MFYKETLAILVLLLIPCINLVEYRDPYDDPRVRKKFADFHCFKLKTCTPGGGKVCAFDQYNVQLAEFEDICTMHKVNCGGGGLFFIVEPNVCTRQKEFEIEHNFTDAKFVKFTTKSFLEIEI